MCYDFVFFVLTWLTAHPWGSVIWITAQLFNYMLGDFVLTWVIAHPWGSVTWITAHLFLYARWLRLDLNDCTSWGSVTWTIAYLSFCMLGDFVLTWFVADPWGSVTWTTAYLSFCMLGDFILTWSDWLRILRLCHMNHSLHLFLYARWFRLDLICCRSLRLCHMNHSLPLFLYVRWFHLDLIWLIAHLEALSHEP